MTSLKVVTYTTYSLGSSSKTSQAELAFELDNGTYWGRDIEDKEFHHIVLHAQTLTYYEVCDEGWREDETACGDPEHCSPVYECYCGIGRDS